MENFNRINNMGKLNGGSYKKAENTPSVMQKETSTIQPMTSNEIINFRISGQYDNIQAKMKRN
jgi:hypothetical protein